MRHGSGNRRQRGRNSGRRNNAPNRSQVFDSNGPDVRIRGTAHQIVEKYAALAKDASASGDRTLAENYLQHAEHYQRIISTWDEEARLQKEASNQEEALDKQEPAEGRTPKQRAKQEPASGEDLGLPASMLKEAPVEEKESESA